MGAKGIKLSSVFLLYKWGVTADCACAGLAAITSHHDQKLLGQSHLLA